MGAALMTWPELLDRPKPEPMHRLSHGPDPLQSIEVWRPEGPGPFPVVLMVHGGCWTTSVATVSIMAWAAEDLRCHGLAVWSLEYRGVDRPGGGYPGTFADVAAGADALTAKGLGFGFDPHRVVALGHSAGGHLALWLASRPHLPATSPLWRAQPLRVHAAISSGGLGDLAAARALGEAACGAPAVDALVGSPHRSDPFADTSAAVLPPPEGSVVLIDGDQDRISPPSLNAALAASLNDRGGRARHMTVAQTGHVELIAPGTAAWRRTREELERLFAAIPSRP